jgi:hypothetical protein
VASVERVSVADALFEVPAGFTASSGMAGLARFASLFKSSASTGASASVAPAAMDPAADTQMEPSAVADTGPRPQRSAPRRAPNPYRSISLFDDPE